ncbi:MAG: hypothetical protein HY735_27760 [Verrucomicrobia bacterium]|nr:hypothetical protein [Verrucomicrobiota bacterium]
MRALWAVESRRQFILLAALLGICLIRSLWFEPKPSHTQWEPQIRAFEDRDKTNPPPKRAILAVGSSSIHLWKTLKVDLDPLPVVRRGFGGATIPDVIAFADRIILPYEPRIVLLYVGENDLAIRRTGRQVLMDFRKLVRLVRSRLPNTQIAFISMKPSITRIHLFDRIRRANALIKAETDRHDYLDYIDIFTPMVDGQRKPRAEFLAADGLHLNAKGYQLWSSILRQHLPQHAFAAAE